MTNTSSLPNKLQQHFPMIRTREEILSIIQKDPILAENFSSWEETHRQLFLDMCTGVRGMKILYDSFFKELFSPEFHPDRLERFLSLLLNRRVKIRQILPNDSVRIADENTLLITDIIVELEDGSLANLEIQKIGYAFPGQRMACYAADMLLRQYKRVYVIVLIEKSPGEFHKFPEKYIHHSRQKFDTGLKLDLLEEFILIPLDIFKKTYQNKNIQKELDAWLAFLSFDSPDKILELVASFPEFEEMYREVYHLCQNVEGAMDMFFSEELLELDRNTVQYMIEEQEKQIQKNEQKIQENEQKIQENEQKIQENKQRLREKQQQLRDSKQQLQKKQQQLRDSKQQLQEKQQQLQEKDDLIRQMQQQIDDLTRQLAALTK